MADPTLKRTSVQIKYTSSDGYRFEFSAKAGAGSRNLSTGEEVPPQYALIEAIEEMARLCALFGFEADARKAADGAFARVAKWRKKRAEGSAG